MSVVNRDAPPRSPRERAADRARAVATTFQAVAYVLMLLAIWGAPVRAVLVANNDSGPLWRNPWHLWAMSEWTVACLAASYLLWCAGDWVRDELVPTIRQ